MQLLSDMIVKVFSSQDMFSKHTDFFDNVSIALISPFKLPNIVVHLVQFCKSQAHTILCQYDIIWCQS